MGCPQWGAEQGTLLGDELDGEMHAAGGAFRVECPPWRRSLGRGATAARGPDFAASGDRRNGL
eukprot:8126945-Pyramimonas_sp.AAC.1